MAQQIKAFASYGILAHEKRPVYSENAPASDVYDEIVIEVPDFIEVSETKTGHVFTIKGNTYTFNQLIYTHNNDQPGFRWNDGRADHFILLEVVSE